MLGGCQVRIAILNLAARLDHFCTHQFSHNVHAVKKGKQWAVSSSVIWCKVLTGSD